MEILFINSCEKQCGIYQYGKRLYDILKKSNNKYIYQEMSNIEEYLSLINNEYDCILYNYHPDTLFWLNDNNKSKTHKNIAFYHEGGLFLTFDYVISVNPVDINSISRCLVENITKQEIIDEEIKEFINYKRDGDIIIGSFGFGFHNKGFTKIIDIVNEQYDSAIIKLVMPNSFFGDNDGKISLHVEELCHQHNKKEKIKLLITHKFLTDTELLDFLSSNDINLFLYDKMEGRGPSSTIDYALSVKKPIGISNSSMFNHIYDDKICVYKNSINDIINNSTTYLSQFNEKWSNENLISQCEIYIKHVLNTY